VVDIGMNERERERVAVADIGMNERERERESGSSRHWNE